MVYETKINEKVETIDILVTPCVGTVSIFIGSSFNHIINDLYLGQSEMKDRKQVASYKGKLNEGDIIFTMVKSTSNTTFSQPPQKSEFEIEAFFNSDYTESNFIVDQKIEWSLS